MLSLLDFITILFFDLLETKLIKREIYYKIIRTVIKMYYIVAAFDKGIQDEEGILNKIRNGTPLFQERRDDKSEIIRLNVRQSLFSANTASFRLIKPSSRLALSTN